MITREDADCEISGRRRLLVICNTSFVLRNSKRARMSGDREVAARRRENGGTVVSRYTKRSRKQYSEQKGYPIYIRRATKFEPLVTSRKP